MKTFGLLAMAPSSWQASTRMVRVVVATTSQAKAVAAMQQAGIANLTINHLRNYGGETWNEDEIAVATSKPGTVFWAEDSGRRAADNFHAVEVPNEDSEIDLPLLHLIAKEGLPFKLDVVDDSKGTGRCYLDLENTDTDELYRLELTRHS